MSWLARSIADSLRIDDYDNENTDDDDDDDEEQQQENSAKKTNPKHRQNEEQEDGVHEEDDRLGRGVREDITEFTETLTRQLWGVASFLARPPPPPPPPPPLPPPSRHVIDRAVDDRDHSDHVDQSRNEVEFEMWNMESDLRPVEQEEEEDEIGEAVGVTEEVLAFAMNIAHHPETWLDFPMEEEDDVDGMPLFCYAY